MRCQRVQVSGTTATVAIVLGWELLVANVGDSCAYLDTGAEVLLARTTARTRNSLDALAHYQDNEACG